MSTLNELLARAQEVRDEQTVGGNTALRVGQLLADIIQWCADTDADFVESVEHYVALLNERDGIINWWQSRVILLKTMGSDFDDVDVSTLNDGDIYYDNVGQWLFERENEGSTNGHHPSEGVLYVNLATKTSYQWSGTSFQVAIEGGGGASSVTAFAQYSVVESTSELPSVGDPTTGYIVGTHIYAYVGEDGDTADGKYQDLGELNAAGVSVTTNGDGTFTIHAGGNDYTVNLNHTHENMAKLIVCEESNLPSTLDPATIYAITDSGETEIEKLIIRNLEFAGGGGVPSTDPILQSPLSGKSIDFGDNQTATLLIRGKNLLAPLTLVVSGDVTVTSNGSQVSTISASDANNGVLLTLTKGSDYSGGSLAISSDELETRTVNLVFELPTGFLANKAWSDKTLVDAPGYCIGPKFNVASGHSYEVEFGFTRPADDVLKYGLVGTSDANFISAGTAGQTGTGYWAPQTGTSRTINSIAGAYGSCTFKMSELANCYIKDTTANTYVWKGNNVT